MAAPEVKLEQVRFSRQVFVGGKLGTVSELRVNTPGVLELAVDWEGRAVILRVRDAVPGVRRVVIPFECGVSSIVERESEAQAAATAPAERSGARK